MTIFRTSYRGVTEEGGFTSTLVNDTGATSIKGTIVEASSTVNNGFDVAGASSDDAFGVVYDDGIADGELCRVVVAGNAEVLLKDTTAGTRHNWVKTSDTAGRADATTGSPPGADVAHWQEIGHCAQSVGSGTDVLCRVALHFN